MDSYSLSFELCNCAESGDITRCEEILNLSPVILNSSSDRYRYIGCNHNNNNENNNHLSLDIDIDIDINIRGGHLGYTPLMNASHEAHKEIVELLLDRCADINAQCNQGKTAISYAISNNHEKIISLL